MWSSCQWLSHTACTPSSLPVDTSDTFGPVGLTTRADTPLSLPALMLMQSIREVAGSTAG